MQEFQKTLKKLENQKAAGTDNIIRDRIKYGGYLFYITLLKD